MTFMTIFCPFPVEHLIAGVHKYKHCKDDFFLNRNVIFFRPEFFFDCRLMINPVICSAVSLTQQLHNNFVSYSSDCFELRWFQSECS